MTIIINTSPIKNLISEISSTKCDFSKSLEDVPEKQGLSSFYIGLPKNPDFTMLIKTAISTEKEAEKYASQIQNIFQKIADSEQSRKKNILYLSEQFFILDLGQSKRDVFIKREILGKGSFKTVQKVISLAEGKIYAFIQANSPAGNIVKSDIKTDIDNEYTAVKRLQKKQVPYILKQKKLYDPVSHKSYILSEYCNEGDLFEYLQKDYPLQEIFIILIEVSNALSSIHKHGICHLDIKPENILLQRASDGILTIKIGDFGFCQKIGSKGRKQLGSYQYVAPEMMMMITEKEYTDKMDVFSFGMIMFEVLLRNFYDRKIASLLDRADKNNLQLLQEILKTHKNPMVLLVLECIECNPENRPSMKKIHETLSDLLLKKSEV